jgi:ABC-2 type transport system ATP-binding protein
MKHLAGEGRTVFVSSHLMSEMAVTADNLIVIGRGRLIADCSTAEFIDHSSHKSVLVKAADPTRLTSVLTDAGGKISAQDDGGLVVRSLDARHIGELASRSGVVLWELSPQLASLEDAFRALTHDNRDFRAPPAPETAPDLDPVPVLAGAAPAESIR